MAATDVGSCSTRQVATAAVNALLSGPSRSERSAGVGSEIPGGTRLRGIVIANGVARVDFSSEYESGASSRSLQLRLAQVVYTLTQFPTVSAVRFSVDGTAVNDRAVGRSAYKGLARVERATCDGDRHHQCCELERWVHGRAAYGPIAGG